MAALATKEKGWVYAANHRDVVLAGLAVAAEHVGCWVSVVAWARNRASLRAAEGFE